MVGRFQLAGLALASLWPCVAQAGDVWVDASAPAGGDGSMASPFTELQDGLAAAMPGDTVRVLPGTYGAISSVRHGQEGERIVVRAESARTAIVQADGTALRVEHDHHTFEGLVFDSAYGSNDGVRGGGDHLVLSDVEVRRATGDCIDLRNATDVTIEHASIHHCIAVFNPTSNADAHGVTGDSVFDLTIRDSEIYLLTGDAIQLSPSRSPWGNLRVERTLMWSGPLDEDANGWRVGQPIGENAFDSKVDDTGLDGSGSEPRAVFIDVVAYGWRGAISNQGAFNVKERVDFLLDRATIHDSELAFRLRAPARVRVQNVVVWDVDRAFRLEDGLADLEVYNVTVGDEIALGAIQTAGGAPAAPTFANMLFLGEAVPDIAMGPSNLAVDGNVFVDAGAHDYRLVMGSTPVDAGEAIDGVDEDRLGVARPFGSAFDIGAFEWTDMPPPGDTDGDDDGSGDGGTASTGSGGSGGSGSTTSPDTDGSQDASSDSTAGAAEGGGCSCRSTHPDRHGAPLVFLLFVLGYTRRNDIRRGS